MDVRALYLTSGANADGEIVWSWRPKALASSSRVMLSHHADDGGKREGSPRSNCVEVDRRAAGLKAGAGRATAFGG